MKRIKGLLCLLSLTLLIHSQNIETMDEILERKVESILTRLTVEEKIAMCTGAEPEMAFKGVPRLRIPNVLCCDGPRGPNIAGAATAFPSGVLFGATWNPEIVELAGKVIGEETRAIGRGVLLGPGNNIQRDPLNGRFFEYFSEDPYLCSAITVANIKGIQSEGIAACLKHYACNNREENRNFYMSMVDDRTMHEIYLPAYKAAVQEGGVWAIMTSANGINNEFVSDSKKMLTDILKNDWGFDGFVLTDWLQTRSTEKAALAGLDVSMPGGASCGFGTSLLNAVKEGRVPESIIDDKVKRILRIYGRIGVLDGRNISEGATINSIEHQEVARKIAEDGMVILKNDSNLLPLNENSIKKVLVTGPNADKLFCIAAMGGSSGILSPYEITPLSGIKKLLGDSKVEYFSTDSLGGFSVIPASMVRTEKEGGLSGWKASYTGGGKTVQRVDNEVNFMWEMKSPHTEIPADYFSANYQGWITPPVSGIYTLRLTVGGWSAIFPEGCYGAPSLVVDGSIQRTATASIQLEKNVPYFFCVNYSKTQGQDASICLEWKAPETSSRQEQLAKLDEAAKSVDVVIFVGGLDHNLDTEGRDRLTMDFPDDQEKLINRLADFNKRMVVVLINGSPIEISEWLPNVSAVLEAWYPGMEGGTAIANLLFGRINPSGKLPFSWPKKLTDVPSRIYGTQNADKVNYSEGIFLGYRYFDTREKEVEFPFGHGLSYTTFSYEDLQLTIVDSIVYGSVIVRNTGYFDGADVVQVYVKPKSPSEVRPIHELKAFQKVYIEAGKSVLVHFELKKEAFSYYSTQSNSWIVDNGKYDIEIASSSKDIKLSQGIMYQYNGCAGYRLKNEKAKQISVYPNPVESELRLNLPNLSVGVLEIYDIHGSKLISKPMAHKYNDEMVVDLQGIPQGMYLLKIGKERVQFIKI